MTDLPPVSCLCLTQGRVELLEEAIHSFLQQDYSGPKELIVVNDEDRQILVYDHPEVRIVNAPARFSSRAEKYKAAADQALHDLLVVWHDEDIYLPHRLSFTVAHFGPYDAFFRADKAWRWDHDEISGLEEKSLLGGSCWRRDLFLKVHGYPHLGEMDEGKIEMLCVVEAPGSLHVLPVELKDIYQIRRREGVGEIPSGRLQLHPGWREDYVALVRSYLETAPRENRGAEAEEIPFPPPFHVIPPPRPLPAERADALFRGSHAARISVILPAANESVMLQRTVEQFAETLPADSEVIVVDNGSTDGCSDFLAKGECENVHLFRTAKPLGVAAARNYGLARARGEIVVFADAHVDLPAHWWQPIVCALNRPDVGVVGPAIGVMGRPDHARGYGQRIAEAQLRLEWLPWQAAEPHPVPTLGGGFMAMRHETLERAGAFDIGMGQWGSEDLELCVRYWLLGYEVWVVPEVTVLHYFRNARPYSFEGWLFTHNLLRVALLHFNRQRTARVMNALKHHPELGEALAFAMESDVWQKRAELASRRVRDDDWLFEKFVDSCQV